jgi:hypothetical protein
MNIALLQRSPTYTHPSNRKKRRLPGTPIHDFHEVYRRRRIQIVKDRIPLPRWADAHPTNPKPGSVGTPVGQLIFSKNELYCSVNMKSTPDASTKVCFLFAQRGCLI